MRAVLFDHYGPPEALRLGELPMPTPRTEVRVRVRAASVNAADWRVMRADPFLARLAFGLLTPRVRVLGADVSGVVEAVGDGVTRLRPGDEVFGELLGPLHATGGRRMARVEARTTLADLELLRRLIDDEKVTPIIERTFSLEQVPAAIAHVEAGHAQGKVVIAVAAGATPPRTPHPPRSR